MKDKKLKFETLKKFLITAIIVVFPIIFAATLVLLTEKPNQAEAAAAEAEFIRIKVDSTSGSDATDCSVPIVGNCSQIWNMFYTNDGTFDEFNVTANNSSTAGYVCGLLLSEEFGDGNDHDMIVWVKKGVILGKNSSLSADIGANKISCCSTSGGTDCDMNSCCLTSVCDTNKNESCTFYNKQYTGNCQADVLSDANYVYQKSYSTLQENLCASDNFGPLSPCHANGGICCSLSPNPPGNEYRFRAEALCNDAGKWAVCDDPNACATDGTNDYACDNINIYPNGIGGDWTNCTAQGKVCNLGNCVAECDVRPTLTISPTPQRGKAGNPLNPVYTVAVKNNDKAGCTARDFDLSITLNTLGGVLGTTSLLNIAAGASASTTYTLTVPAGTPAGNYNFKIRAEDQADATLFDEKPGVYTITTCMSGDDKFVEFDPDSYVVGDVLKVAYGINPAVATGDYRVCVYNPAGTNFSWTINTNRELFTHYAGTGDAWNGSTGITGTLGTWVVSLEEAISCPAIGSISDCRGSAEVTPDSGGGGGGGGGGGAPPCGWMDDGLCGDSDLDTFNDDLAIYCGPGTGCGGAVDCTGVCPAAPVGCTSVGTNMCNTGSCVDSPSCLAPCQWANRGCVACPGPNCGKREYKCEGSGGNPKCNGGVCVEGTFQYKADKQCLYESLGCLSASCPGGVPGCPLGDECPKNCGIAGCCVEEGYVPPIDCDCSEVVYGTNKVLNNFDPDKAEITLDLSKNEAGYIVLPVGANIRSDDGNPTSMGTSYDGDTTDFALLLGDYGIPINPNVVFSDLACPLESILKNCSCSGCQITSGDQWGIEYCKVPISGTGAAPLKTLKLSLKAPNYFIKYEMPPLPLFPSGLVPCGRHTDDPTSNLDESANCSLCHTLVLTKRGIDFGVAAIILPLVGILAIVGGGFLIFSGGSPKNIGTGKAILFTTGKGAALALAGWLLIETVIAGLVPNSAPWRDWKEVVCDVAPCEVDGNCDSVASLTADGNHITKGTGEDAQSCPSDCACNIAEGAGCGGPNKKECNFDGNCEANETAGIPEPCPDCAVCGNGAKEIGEECDGADFGVILNDKIAKAGGQQLCLMLAGYAEGNFSCADCKLDTENCKQK